MDRAGRENPRHLLQLVGVDAGAIRGLLRLCLLFLG